MARTTRRGRDFQMEEAQGAQPPQGNLRSRFIPLAESRMTAVLEAMDYLAQLSMRTRYHYTDEEWELMRRTLQTKLDELDSTFKRGRGSRPVFKFGGEC